MSTRKRAGESWESSVDRQIREAQQRGAFDDLPGAGKPIADLHRPYDELWWVRKKLEEEGLSYLPPSLQLRRAVEVARGRIEHATTEHEVRGIVAAVNRRIRDANRLSVGGPPTSLMPLDEDRTVQGWRERRTGEQPD